MSGVRDRALDNYCSCTRTGPSICNKQVILWACMAWQCLLEYVLLGASNQVLSPLFVCVVAVVVVVVAVAVIGICWLQ